MRSGLVVALLAMVALSGVVRAQGVEDTVKAASDAVGLMRGFKGVDITISTQYDATGSMLVGGQMVTVPRYRASIRYDVPGMRVEYNLGDGAQKQQHIEVVAGALAWNEDRPGAGLVKDYGTATPAPGAATERLLHLWMTPLGAIKAAMSAGAKVKLSTAGGQRVLTFPLAAPLGNVIMAVTLDKDNRPERVEGRLAGRVFEATYSDYKDHLPMPTNTYLPSRIVQKRDGQTVLDLTVTQAWTMNPYVIFPIPPSVGMGRASR